MAPHKRAAGGGRRLRRAPLGERAGARPRGHGSIPSRGDDRFTRQAHGLALGGRPADRAWSLRRAKGAPGDQERAIDLLGLTRGGLERMFYP